MVSAVHIHNALVHLSRELVVRADDEGFLGAEQERAQRNYHRLAGARGPGAYTRPLAIST